MTRGHEDRGKGWSVEAAAQVAQVTLHGPVCQDFRNTLCGQRGVAGGPGDHRTDCVYLRKGAPIMHTEQLVPHSLSPATRHLDQPEPSEAEIEACSAQVDSFVPRSPLFWLDYARWNVRRRVFELKVVSQQH